MKSLYPEITNPTVYDLKVSDVHQLHLEECGNPSGIPIIFLHGGPGSGCQPYHRQFFDPEKYRIIIFDQRGCGRSTPHGNLEDNTTHDLLADMETIRKTLKIDQWVLFGGSWGVTLALLYAQTYPQHISGIVLRGAFLASKRDLEWFFGDGVGRIFPDEWERFTALLDDTDYTYLDVIEDYHEMITSVYDTEKIKAAQAWSRWTGKIVTWTLPQNEDKNSEEKEPEKLIREIHLEVHYAVNKYFLETDQLITNIDRLPDVPVEIVHGRRDITCPLESSWKLHKSIPNSSLTILPESGHLANETAMIDALVTITDGIAEKLK